jgi:membrane protease YdiL (CAAX protease family)
VTGGDVDFLTDPAALEPGLVSWYTLAFLVLMGPLVALRAHRVTKERGGPPAMRTGRIGVYLGALLWLWVLLVLAWVTVRETGMELFPPWRPGRVDVLVGLASFGLGMLTIVPGLRLVSDEGRARVRAVAPRTAGERSVFYVLCVAAGVGEEIVYRGVLFTLFAVLTGSWWLAAALAALVFGAMHLYQGPRTAGLAGLYGLRDHVVVGLTGTLWVAIVVHIVHDAVLGTMVGRRARLDESTGSGGAGGADPRAGAGDDPLEALRAGLAARGIELDQAMVDEVRRELERDDTGSR